MDLGVERHDAVVEHLGRAGDLLDGRDRDARLGDEPSPCPPTTPARSRARAGRARSRPGRSCRTPTAAPACSRAPPSWSCSRGSTCAGRGGARPSLMRSCNVSSVSSGRTGTDSWARIGPSSTSSVREVHRAACHLHPGRERVAHRVPALERRQQRRVRVDDRARGTRRAPPATRIVPKPAIATRSTSWRFSASTTRCVYASRSKSAPNDSRSTASTGDARGLGPLDGARTGGRRRPPRSGARRRAMTAESSRFPTRGPRAVACSHAIPGRRWNSWGMKSPIGVRASEILAIGSDPWWAALGARTMRPSQAVDRRHQWISASSLAAIR